LGVKDDDEVSIGGKKPTKKKKTYVTLLDHCFLADQTVPIEVFLLPTLSHPHPRLPVNRLNHVPLVNSLQPPIEPLARWKITQIATMMLIPTEATLQRDQTTRMDWNSPWERLPTTPEKALPEARPRTLHLPLPLPRVMDEEDVLEDQTNDHWTPMDIVSLAVMRKCESGNSPQPKSPREPSLLRISPQMEMEMRMSIRTLHHTVYVMDRVMAR